MHKFIDLWAPELKDMVRIVSYESLMLKSMLPRAAYIFSDIERLSKEQLPALNAIYSSLQDDSSVLHLLNHPSRSMKRYELLRTLFMHGYNRHNIYRVDEMPHALSFPVFVRGEDDHYGSLTGLIYSSDKLDSELQRLMSAGHANLVIVEFCDTSDKHGLYRKYSAYVIGDTIIPQHMMISDRWHMKGVRDLAIKKSDLYEEREYIRDNPHEHKLREICRLVKIGYGRIDYGLIDGNPVIWEINTNPTIMSTRLNQPKCCVTRSPFVTKIVNVFVRINCKYNPDSVIKSPLSYSYSILPVFYIKVLLTDSWCYFRNSIVPRLKRHSSTTFRGLKNRLAGALRI